MATARVDDAEIYYEKMGEGQPLVLIMGLGGNADWWGAGFQKHLAKSRQVIAFDNRGAARTKIPDNTFSIERMADDVALLMDELGLSQADVFGVSMGGMIGQEVALRHPAKVRKLVLGCTSCGGTQQVPPTVEALQLLLSQPKDEAEAMENQVRLLFPNSFVRGHRPLLAESFRMLSQHPMSQENFMRQFAAIQQWQGTFDRLPTLTHDTLLMHGTEDILLPAQNSEILQVRLPHARFIRYKECGHGFTFQAATQVLADLDEFLC